MKRKLIIFGILVLIPLIAYAATRNITPRADGEGGIGTVAKRWGEAHFDEIEAVGNVGIGITAPEGLLHAGTAPSSGLIVQASGNVGIGTTAPTQVLEVTGTSIAVSSNEIDFSDVTDEYVLAFDTGAQKWRGVVGGAGGGEWTDGGTFIYPTEITDYVGIGYTAPQGILHAGTGPSQGLIVQDTGFVGIGTTAPSEALEVVGDVKFKDVDPHTEWECTTAGHDDYEAYAYDSEWYLVNLDDGAIVQVSNMDWMFKRTASFDEEFNNGNSGGADTIDWTVGNKQSSLLTDNVTYTFSRPMGTCNLVLRLQQDNTGSRIVTWPVEVQWPSGNAPTLTTTGNAVDIVSFYFASGVYYGQYALDFSR